MLNTLRYSLKSQKCLNYFVTFNLNIQDVFNDQKKCIVMLCTYFFNSKMIIHSPLFIGTYAELHLKKNVIYVFLCYLKH